jgi:hypothetical protein
MNFVTAADEGYFHFVYDFVEKTREVFPYANIVVYDLGMTTEQMFFTKAMGAIYCKWDKVQSNGKYPEGYTPRALHKPSMLFHAARNLAGPIVYMDVDAYPVAHFEVPDCDVAVTMKRRDVMKLYKDTPLEEYLGRLDAGTIMFGTGEARELFIAKWAMDMQDDPNPSDQKSLNNIIDECHDWIKYNVTRKLLVGGDPVRVQILHEGNYNSAFLHPDAKIIHKRVHEQ